MGNKTVAIRIDIKLHALIFAIIDLHLKIEPISINRLLQMTFYVLKVAEMEKRVLWTAAISLRLSM